MAFCQYVYRHIFTTLTQLTCFSSGEDLLLCSYIEYAERVVGWLDVRLSMVEKQTADKSVSHHLGQQNVEEPPTAPWTEVVRLFSTHIIILSVIRSLVHQAFFLLLT